MISLISYVRDVIPKPDERKYFVFWQEGKILLTNRDRIFQAVRFLGSENVLKPISEIMLPLSDMICDKYIKINKRWYRED